MRLYPVDTVNRAIIKALTQCLVAVEQVVEVNLDSLCINVPIDVVHLHVFHTCLLHLAACNMHHITALASPTNIKVL